MDDWGIGAAEWELLAQWQQSQGEQMPIAPAAPQPQPQTIAPIWPQQGGGGGGWAGQGQIITPAMRAAGITTIAPAGKGGGMSYKGMGMVEDPIFIAINTAMANVPPEELITEQNEAWDPDTLKRRIAKYFKSAAKNLSFSGSPEKVINEFADAALGNVSWALQGTKWLNKADFTLVLETAISELFPDEFKAEHPAHALEEIILKAHDRALEDALFAPVLMDTVKELVEGKKSSNKVHNAAEAARRDLVEKMNASQDDSADFHSAFENGVQEKIEQFVAGWIQGTLKSLGDWPESIIDRQTCTTLFQRLVCKEDVCLPRSLVRYMVEPIPEDWEFVTNTINAIYDAAEANAEEQFPSKKKQRKDYIKDYDGPNWTYKTEVCRNIAQTGHCKMGDWCVFAHDETELYLHRSGALGPGLPYGRGHEAEGELFPLKGKKKGFGGPGMMPYGKAGFAPMGFGKGKGPYGKACKGGPIYPSGGCSKGGYGKGGYGKSGGKRYGRQEERLAEEDGEQEQEEALEEEEGEFGEDDGPGAYAHEVEEP
mmetsp:Transcript_93953/g.148469  ORF Transcript_93953/g.148469 Transcript_93953/m.148469 type:complete len:540 (-) Transcript_93953:88-1707(-)